VIETLTTGKMTLSRTNSPPAEDTSAGGLLVPESVIFPVVSVSITELIPLLEDY
jgi:hypothetical protein